jgi:flagellar basal body-associated protein FliL
MPPEETAPEKTAQAEPKKERSGALKTLVTLAVIFGVFGALGAVLTRVFVLPRVAGTGSIAVNGEGNTTPGEPQEPGVPPVFYDPISLIVNIDDKGVDRFLIVEISLQLENENVKTELAAIEPQIKDMFIGVLRSKTYEELKGARGQDNLRRELVTKANTLLKGGRVRDAFFSKLQVQ